ncbi:hypothetical protein [Neobacillus sp. PS3-40]|uniref:hypothetical protein n=1 Tax=Neobacillus sp. PS3-40 TaxID=3070679 RepID=UPI0027E1C842|nr:hypothetical protein [Neobacillus sp. PS3-40]WML45688.1 hypothetical protein RCG20_07230 [Neobacillus sp. PS3-40]
MRKPFKTIVAFLISALVLSACSNTSYKEESKVTVKAVKTTFKEKIKRPNNKSVKIRFYLPFGYEIKDKSPHNIILKNGSKTYILFNNPQENASSNVVYKASIAQYKQLETNETFKDQKRMGYLIVARLKDGMNELTIGIGGTKITTQAKTSSLKEEATAMMQIMNSVKTINK